MSQEALPSSQIEHVDVRADQTYVLVSLDRAAWAAGLRQRLSEVDQALVTSEQRYQPDQVALLDERDALITAKHLTDDVMPLIAERGTLTRRLALAAPQSPIPAMPIDLTALKRLMARLVNNISVMVHGDGLTAVEAALVEALSQQGLRIRRQAPSQLHLHLTISEQPLEHAGMTRLDGQLMGELRNSAGDVLGIIRAKGRSSSQVTSVARSRLHDQLARTSDCSGRATYSRYADPISQVEYTLNTQNR